MSKKHAFLRFFSKITIFACVFCTFFISPVFATLPTGYTELEYIESTGTQYIDTGIIGNNNTKFDISFQNTGGTGMVFGSRTSASSNAFAVWTSASSLSSSLRFGFDGTGGYTGEAPLTDRISLSFDGEQLYRDGVVAWTKPSVASFTTPSNLLLFAYYNKNNIVYAQVKVFVLKLYDGDTLVRNFIPAKRNSDSVLGMYDTVTNTFFTNSGTVDFTAGPVAEIKIATTKYVDDEFAPLDTALANAISVVDNVVTQTIAQAGQIATLQNTKQNRPSDDNECPAGKKCLLVMDENGTPHWYEIIEPAPAFNAIEFLNQLINTNGNNGYYAGNTTTYNELGNSGSASTSQPPASSGLRQLNEKEWVVQWNGKGAVYGTSVCNSNNGTYGVASSTEQTETKGQYCWCKMTSVGGLDGVEHDVSSSWVLESTYVSAAYCAELCANRCAYIVRNNASFRSAVLGSVN